MMKRFESAALMTFANSRYGKKKFGTIMRYGTTIGLRSLLTFFVGALLSTGMKSVDYIIQIIVTISMFLITDILYSGLLEFQDEFESLGRYIIENYSEENMRRWKRYFVLLSCAYSVLMCSLFDMTPKSTMIYSVQFFICYVITDEIENGNGPIHKISMRIYDSLYSHLKTKTYETPVLIVDDYAPDSAEKLGKDPILDFVTMESNTLAIAKNLNNEDRSLTRDQKISKFKDGLSEKILSIDDDFIFSEIKVKKD